MATSKYGITHLRETIATSYMYTLLWTKEIDVVLNHINYWNTEGGGAGGK